MSDSDDRQITSKWVPLLQVGIFRFGERVDALVERGMVFQLSGAEDYTGWRTYGVPGASLRVHVEEGRIISIACYSECIYQGRNLIGLGLREVSGLLGENPAPEVGTIDIDNCPHEVYEFEEMGAQIWVKQGVVDTVFCFDPRE